MQILLHVYPASTESLAIHSTDLVPSPPFHPPALETWSGQSLPENLGLGTGFLFRLHTWYASGHRFIHADQPSLLYHGDILYGADSGPPFHSTTSEILDICNTDPSPPFTLQLLLSCIHHRCCPPFILLPLRLPDVYMAQILVYRQHCNHRAVLV